MAALSIDPKQPALPENVPLLPFRADILAGQLAPSSIAMYERDMRAYLAFAGDSASAIDASTLARWRTHLAQATEMSPNTINRMLSAVKRVMLEAAAQGYLQVERAEAFRLVAGVKAAALKDRVKPNARTRIEPAEMRALCNTPNREKLIGVRDAALLATLAGGGLRVSELRQVRFSRIKRKGAGFIVLVRGKNDVEEREAPLSSEAHRAILEWLDLRQSETGVACDVVFTAFDGRGDRMTDRPLSSAAVWQIVRKYSLHAGFADIKPHDFRRFVGTQLARKDIRQAQKALGHKRLETTARHYVLDELEPGLTDELYSEIPALLPQVAEPYRD